MRLLEFCNMSNAIELRQVTKRFGKQVAVDNLNLSVPQGAIYGFIGPNGSGKTTTLRMILRIFQPDSGTVNVLGAADGKRLTTGWVICPKNVVCINGCGFAIF